METSKWALYLFDGKGDTTKPIRIKNPATVFDGHRKKHVLEIIRKRLRQ